MRAPRLDLLARSLLMLSLLLLPMACAVPAGRPPGEPWLIAHRGASGTLLEHTFEAYALAHERGADFIEPDVVMTRDGELICSHELTVPETTDVAERFPGRARPDGRWWFADLDLAEVRTLVRNDVREPSTSGQRYMTLDEMLQFVLRLNAVNGREAGVIPEPKDPAFHRAEGLPLEAALLQALARHGWRQRDDAAIVQCFDQAALRRMREDLGTDLKLVWLTDEPFTEAGLDRLAGIVDGIAPSRDLFDPDTEAAAMSGPDDIPADRIVPAAHARGLLVVPWTFDDDMDDMLRFDRAHDVDGYFTDYVGEAVQALRRD